MYITRVAGGWIYQTYTEADTQGLLWMPVFVPYSNEMKHPELKDDIIYFTEHPDMNIRIMRALQGYYWDLDKHVSMLDLNSLSFEEIASMSEYRLSRVRNVGKKTIKQIQDILSYKKLKLKP